MPAQRNPTTPWGNRKQIIAGGGVAAVCAILSPFWPVGASAWVIMVLGVVLWPGPERFEEDAPDQLKAKTVQSIKKLVFGRQVWRLGPLPGCAEQADGREAPTWWSPLSFSTIAAAVVSVGAAGLDIAISYSLAVHVPPIYYPEFWIASTQRLVIFTAPISAICGWCCTQSYIYLKRLNMYAEEEGGDEYGIPPAAVMKTGLSTFLVSFFKSKLFYVVAALSVGAFLAISSTGYPTFYIGWPATVVLYGTFVAAACLTVTLIGEFKAQHKKWHDRKYEERQWRLRWTGARGLSLEEWRAPIMEDMERYPKEGNPTHCTILFRLKSGTQFSDFAKASRQIASSMASQRVLIERFWQRQGEENLFAFSLSYQLKDVHLAEHPHLDSSLDDDTLKFAVKYAMITAFRELKFSTPLFISMEVLSEPGHDLLVETTWLLTDGATFADVSAKTDKLQEKLACGWLRPFAAEGTNYTGIVFGVRPEETTLREPVHIHSRRLLAIEWHHLLRSNSLVGSDGNSPILEESTSAALGLTEMTFRYPPNVDGAKIKTKLDALRGQSGHQYIEFEEHAEDSKYFHLLIGDADPLKLVYNFSDYRDQILREPIRGKPNTDWFVGILANGKLSRYCWDDEQPHLLIAGATGAGKSGIINSMLCQVMHNNHPDDVRIWLAEPKNELHAYLDVAHVCRFVDFMVTEENPHKTFAALLDEGIAEMRHRYKTFSRHPKKPAKIQEARDIAQADPENSGYLNFPYLFIVIEECATYFFKPDDKEERVFHAQIMSRIQRLAREARAAGIYLLVATQYPVKENIPPTLKNQCRSIGLFTQTITASQLIIGEPGLEKIKERGRGKVTDGKRYAGFRGLLMARSEDKANLFDERADLVAGLPQSDIWPKLPEGVEPNENEEIRGSGGMERCPVSPPVNVAELPPDIDEDTPFVGHQGSGAPQTTLDGPMSPFLDIDELLSSSDPIWMGDDASDDGTSHPPRIEIDGPPKGFVDIDNPLRVAEQHANVERETALPETSNGDTPVPSDDDVAPEEHPSDPEATKLARLFVP